jgi:hypothetical protein
LSSPGVEHHTEAVRLHQHLIIVMLHSHRFQTAYYESIAEGRRIARVMSDLTSVERIHYDRGHQLHEAILEMQQKHEPTWNGPISTALACLLGDEDGLSHLFV